MFVKLPQEAFVNDGSGWQFRRESKLLFSRKGNSITNWTNKPTTQPTIETDILLELFCLDPIGIDTHGAHAWHAPLTMHQAFRQDKIMGCNLLRYAFTERNILSYIQHPYIAT